MILFIWLFLRGRESQEKGKKQKLFLKRVLWEELRFWVCPWGEKIVPLFSPPQKEGIAVKAVGRDGSELSLEERRKRVLELLGESGLSGWAAEGFGENSGELTISPSGCDVSSFLVALFLREVIKSSFSNSYFAIGNSMC